MVSPLHLAILLLAVVLFNVGLAAGWILSNHTEVSVDSKLRAVVALVIMFGWITATVSGILIADYTVDPLVHALMGAIVGYFFTEDGFNVNFGQGK